MPLNRGQVYVPALFAVLKETLGSYHSLLRFHVMKNKTLKRDIKSQVKKVPVSIQSITFWLNAFLPRDIAGATTTLRQGSFAGYTAITGPLNCLTDQRNFSNDSAAKSRMHSRFTIDLTKTTPTLTQGQRCDFTTECDPITGEVRNQHKASTKQMGFSLVSAEPQIIVRMSCRASNPGTSAAWAFGDIEYNGLIVIDPVARSFTADLKISLFPAFEGYIAINEGPPTAVFRYAPPAGFGPGRIPTGASRPIRSLLVDHDNDGIFVVPTL